MAVHDFRSQRLFVNARLATGTVFEAEREQANYLLNVLRLKSGDSILLFNGSDGEWIAKIEVSGRKKCRLAIEEQTRAQPAPYSLEYCFAPLKQARLDYMVQKAVEMGVGSLLPVMTQHTQIRSINQKRLRANAIEAAEQCGILNIPQIYGPVALSKMLDSLPSDKTLIFCDEDTPDANELTENAAKQAQVLRLIIGPEGGFSADERALILDRPNVLRLGLGPRILRADTAAVAALAIIQAKLGDWYDDK